MADNPSFWDSPLFQRVVQTIITIAVVLLAHYQTSNHIEDSAKVQKDSSKVAMREFRDSMLMFRDSVYHMLNPE